MICRRHAYKPVLTWVLAEATQAARAKSPDHIGSKQGGQRQCAGREGGTGDGEDDRGDFQVPDEATLLRELALPWLRKEAAQHRAVNARRHFADAADPADGIVGPGGLITMSALARNLYTDRGNLTRTIKQVLADESGRRQTGGIGPETTVGPGMIRTPHVRAVCVRGGTETVSPNPATCVSGTPETGAFHVEYTDVRHRYWRG
jgi:hypothetical protein